MGPGLYSPGYRDAPDSIQAAYERRFNGAGLIQPGIQSDGAPEANFNQSLQWGRAYTARDTPIPLVFRPPSRSASMGPGLYSPGYMNDSWSNQIPIPQASMGPGLYSPGYEVELLLNRCRYRLLQWGRAYTARDTHVDEEQNKRHRCASMGPGLYSPGYPFLELPLCGFLQGFNGAGLIQPGIPVIVSMIDEIILGLQWGRAYTARDTKRPRERVRGVRSFNGAGLIQPGIQKREAAIAAGRHAASMGPGLYSPGYPFFGFKSTPQYERFNGAGLIQPGIL